MNDLARKHRHTLRLAEISLRLAQEAVQAMERMCPHQWRDAVSDPIIRPGYYATSQSWHPGRGREEDHQDWVPEERTPRWTRTCTVCGKVEETTRTTPTTTYKPKF